jgi:hypothetical protein
MQILPKATSMKTFSIVLPIVTVSTLLAVFVLTGALQGVRETLSQKIPNPEPKLLNLTNKAPGQQRGFWTYLASLVELCLVRIPVHEVKEAARLYGLFHRRAVHSNDDGDSITLQHLRCNTTLASGCTQDTNFKTRARQVLELRRAEEAHSRKGLTLQHARHALLATLRLLLCLIWTPLLLTEYLILLIFYCPFTTKLQPQTSKPQQIKYFFAAPLVLLNLDLPFATTNKRTEHRSPKPPNPGPHPSPPPPYMRGAQRFRHIIARPTFQSLPHAYPDVEGGSTISRRAGSFWVVDPPREFC